MLLVNNRTPPEDRIELTDRTPKAEVVSDEDRNWLWQLFKYNHPYFVVELIPGKSTPMHHYYDLFGDEYDEKMRTASSHQMFKFAWFSWRKSADLYETYEDREVNYKFAGSKLEELGVYVDSWIGRQYILCPTDHFDRLPEVVDALVELSPEINLLFGDLNRFTFKWHRGMPPFTRESFEQVFIDTSREKVIEWKANTTMTRLLDPITEYMSVVCPWNYSTSNGKDFCRWLRSECGFAPEFDIDTIPDDEGWRIYQYARCNRVARQLNLFHESDGWFGHRPSKWTIDDPMTLEY